MAQGFKAKKSGGKSGSAHTSRRNHVNVKKSKASGHKSHGLNRGGAVSADTKRINRSIETIIAQAANGPNQGPSMQVAKLDPAFRPTTIKGQKPKNFLKQIVKKHK